MRYRFFNVYLLFFVIISLWDGVKGVRIKRVVNEKMVNRGLYIIQSEMNKKSVLTVADDVNKSQLEGEPLNVITTSKWRNGEDQKWTVKQWGGKYFHLTPSAKQKNILSYKIFMEDFPMPNIWQILNIGNGKHWQIKKYRGKCLTYNGMNEEIGEEKCDRTSTSQLWHFHQLDQ